MSEIKTYDEILAQMEAEFERLSGLPAADCGDIALRMRVLAGELHTMHCRTAKLREAMFPDTARADDLEKHALQRGIYRKKASTARGVIVFSVDEPADFDIIIPARTVCTIAAEEKCQYITNRAEVLKAGQLSVSAGATASDSGKQGNCAAGKITVLITPPAGITSITNPEPFTGGGDAETDEELRARLIRSWSVAPNCVNCAQLEEIALSFEDIIKARAIPIRRGAGTADVMVRFKEGKYSSITLREIKSALRDKAELGMDFSVSNAGENHITVNAELEIREGEDFDLVCEESRKRLSQFIAAMPIGSPVRLCELGKCLLESPAVLNYSFISPAADIPPTATEEIKCDEIIFTRRGQV